MGWPDLEAGKTSFRGLYGASSSGNRADLAIDGHVCMARMAVNKEWLVIGFSENVWKLLAVGSLFKGQVGEGLKRTHFRAGWRFWSRAMSAQENLSAALRDQSKGASSSAFGF